MPRQQVHSAGVGGVVDNGHLPAADAGLRIAVPVELYKRTIVVNRFWHRWHCDDATHDANCRCSQPIDYHIDDDKATASG